MTFSKIGAGLALVILVSCAGPDGATSSKSHQETALLEKRGSTEARKLPAGGTFGKDSTEADVLKVMGTPDDTRQASGGQTVVWTYSFSSITFQNGCVASWVNGSRNLRVRDPEERKREDERIAATSLGSSDGLSAPAGLRTYGRSGATTSSGATNPNIVKVAAHQRANGTSVGSYYKTVPDSSARNNFSSSGNHNTFTGRKGYR